MTLSANFFEQLVAAPVPLDLRAVRALKKSPLALDLYAWATRRVSYLERPTLISWESLRRSFGAGYAETPQGRSCFRAKTLDALVRVCRVYSTLRLEIEDERRVASSLCAAHSQSSALAPQAPFPREGAEVLVSLRHLKQFPQ